MPSTYNREWYQRTKEERRKYRMEYYRRNYEVNKEKNRLNAQKHRVCKKVYTDRICMVCGKTFNWWGNKKICSPECVILNKKKLLSNYYLNHKDKLRPYKAMKQMEYYYANKKK